MVGTGMGRCIPVRAACDLPCTIRAHTNVATFENGECCFRIFPCPAPQKEGESPNHENVAELFHCVSLTLTDGRRTRPLEMDE